MKKPKFGKPLRIFGLMIITLVLTGGIFALFQWKFATKIEAAWFDDAYMYRQRVDITNSGSNQSDYSVYLTLDTATLISAGKMQSDCDDIRVTNNSGKLLPHWIEENDPGCNSATTDIWTRVPDLPTSGAYIFVYYGNPSASDVQKPNSVFDLFDNFSVNTIGKNWLVQNGTWAVTSGALTQAALTGRLESTTIPYNDNFAIESRAKITGESTCYDSLDVNFGNGNEFVDYNFRREGCAYKAEIRGGTPLLTGTFTYTLNQYHRITGTKNGTSYKNIIDGTTRVSGTTTLTNSTFTYIGFYTYEAQGSWDWIAVRKYTSTEPSVDSPTNEEKSEGAAAYWKFDEGTGSVANDSTSSSKNGTINGATWLTEDLCISGKCLKFNGTSDNVGIGNSVPSVQTVSLWVKPTSNTASLINLNLASISASSGTLSATGFTSPTIYVNGIVSSTLTANNWNNVVVTTGTAISNASVTIGKIGSGYTSGFIDEVKLYNYARTAAQVKADYAAISSRQEALGTSLGGVSPNIAGPISTGLVGYWKMDETSTPSVDSSGNSNSGTWTSISSTTGKYGNATLFDASTDLITVNASSSLNNLAEWTSSFWIYPTSFSGGYRIICKAYTCSLALNERTIYYTSSGYIAANQGFVSATDATSQSSTALSLNTWTHVTVTYNSADRYIRIYYNGAEVNYSQQTQAAANATLWDDSGQNLTIGNRGAANSAMTGSLDDVRVYNRALSPAEVSQLYNWAPGPVGYWGLNENTGTTISDSSGNGYNGSLGTDSGSPTWSTGKFGGALNYGSGTYAKVVLGSGQANFATSVSGRSFSYSLWFKTNNVSATQYLLTNNVSCNNYGNFSIGLAGGNIRFAYWGSPDGGATHTFTPSPALQKNQWYHLEWAKTFGQLGVKAYLNGVSQAVSGDSVNLGFGNLDNLLLGAFNGDGVTCTSGVDNVPPIVSNSLTGSLDEIKIYNYARSPKQVIEDMNADHPAGGSPVGSQLAYIKFDEGYSRTSYDSGPNGYNANLGVGSTNPSWTQSGKFGKAISFSGVASTVSLGNVGIGSTSPISVTAWVNLTTSNAVHDIVAKKGASGNYSYRLYTDANGKANFEVSNNGTTTTTVTGLTTLSTSTWYYLAGVYIPSTSLTIYVNANLDAQNLTSIPGTIHPGSANLEIGSENGGSNLMAGLIDEVKVYAYDLTASEVKTDYNNGTTTVLGSLSDNSSYQKQSSSQQYCVPGDTSTCNPPVGEWRFDEGSGATVNDSTGNNNSGTWSGTTTQRYVTGKNGNGGYFNGTDDYLTITNSTLNNSSYTFSAWVRTRETTAKNFNIATNIGGAGTAGANTLGGQTQDSSTTYFSFDAGTYSLTTATVLSNVWHYVTVVKNQSANTISLYLDGVFQQSGDLGTNVNGSSNLILNANSSNRFASIFDQVTQYNYARTPAQIVWDYNRGAPVGWWKMDECQGSTITDWSLNANGKTNDYKGSLTLGSLGQTSAGTCTANADTAWYNGRNGKFNSSLSFDGSDDYVDLGNKTLLDGLTEASICFWMNYVPSSVTADGVIISRYNNSTNGWLIWVDDVAGYGGNTNTMSWAPDPSAAGGRVEGPTDLITSSTWDNYCGTFKGGQFIRLYKNGVLRAENKTSISSVVSSETVNDYIGRSNDGRFLNAILDDLRIYNYALTSGQVQTIYNENFAVRFAPATGTP